MKFQLLSLIFATSTLLHPGGAATLRTRPGTRNGMVTKARRHLQPGKGFVSSGKGGTETSHSSDDRSGDVISRSTGSEGKGSYGKGSANGAVVHTGLSTTRPATGGKGASSLGKGGTPSNGKGTFSEGKGSTTTSPDELLREDSKDKKSGGDNRDASSGDDVGTSSTSDDENTFDLEPAELAPNEIGNNRNFGSVSNDDP